jgi:hypothetical protein
MSSSQPLSHPFNDLQGESARQLSKGGQATVPLVAPSNGGDEIIVKRFRIAAGVDAALKEEVAALERLRSLVGNVQIFGWTICIPTVVAIREQPPTLALTRVPGTPIDRLIQRGWTPPKELSAALAEVFQRYWRSSGRPLGDVNLSNLMCSPKMRQLAIVDPGLPNEVFELHSECRQFYPASRDLGCLLHEVLSTNVLLGLSRRSSAIARLVFVRQVIRACMLPEDDAHAFVNEIGRCAAAHLARVGGGGVLHRAWRVAVRGVAQRALLAEITALRRCLPCG